jgi:O-methyltransferase involved in polyketide biosynthesis
MTRRDGDTWDPATGVGMTATFGARARAVASDKGLIDDPCAEPLVRGVRVQSFIQVVEHQRYGHGGDDPR